MRRTGRSARDRGAAAVEMALITPLLLLLLFGIIDFGRMLNCQITLTEAAREGARAAALGYPATAQATAAANPIAPITVQTTVCPAAANPGVNAVVVVTHNFQPVTPVGPAIELFGGEADGSVIITARGVMPCLG